MMSDAAGTDSEPARRGMPAPLSMSNHVTSPERSQGPPHQKKPDSGRPPSGACPEVVAVRAHALSPVWQACRARISSRPIGTSETMTITAMIGRR